MRDGRRPCLLQVLSGTILAISRDGKPTASVAARMQLLGRGGWAPLVSCHRSPRRPECGSMASSPTSERLLTAPAPRPVLGPVAPPRPAPAGAPAPDLLGQPGPSPAELSLLLPQHLGLSGQGWGPGSAGLGVDPVSTTHVLPSLGRAARLLIASGSPSPERRGHDGGQGSMTYGAISRHPASISPA